MASIIPYSARAALLGDNAISGTPVDLEGDTIKCALLTASASPAETWVYYSDCTNEVASGNGYTTGGATLSNCTVSYSSGVATFDATDATWADSTITARYAAIYKSTGTSSTSPLLAIYDFGASKSSNGGEFRVAFHVNGIIRFT